MNVLLTSLLFAALLPQEVGSVFRDVTYEEALETAAAEERMVLASFVIAESEECERQKSTWTDPAVARWLEVETVAVELDAVERADLVERFGIEEYPTVVLFAGDGTEYDRMRGYARPRHFILAFIGVMETREMIHAARKLVAAAPDDPLARMELARALATARGRESAAAQYEWVWDHARPDPAFRHLRLVKVLTELDALSRKYQPARQLMLKWRRRSVKILEEGEPDDRVLAAREISALNEHLSEPEAMLKLYLKVRDRGDASEELLDALFNGQVTGQLYNQKRYEELLAGLRDPLVRVEALFAELEDFRARVADGRLPPEEAGAVTVLQNGLFAKSALYFETLLIVGRKKEAVELKDYVVTREPVARSYMTMMRSARKARSRELARQIGKDGLAVLEKKQRAELQVAYTQLFGEE